MGGKTIIGMMEERVTHRSARCSPYADNRTMPVHNNHNDAQQLRDCIGVWPPAPPNGASLLCMSCVLE